MIILDKLTETEKRDIEHWFCSYMGANKRRITNKLFLEILAVCWKYRIDMNFDDNPDFETLEYIRGKEYKWYVLEQLSNGYLSGCDSWKRQEIENEFRALLSRK